jgi:hypothetical protein
LAPATERSRFALSLALSEIALLPRGEERDSQLNAIATLLVGGSEEARVQAIQQCPDLAQAKPIPDAQLHTSELEGVSRLKESDIRAIDRIIVVNSTHIWQKATRIVGFTLVDLKNQFPEAPLGFYAQRIAALVQGGKLEVQGDIEFMRLCELRLSSLGKSAA